MGTDWIKVEKSTARKPEVLQIADALAVHPDHAFGLCVRFWCWVDDQMSQECHTNSVTFVTLDSVVGHNGFTEQLVAVGWLELNGTGVRIPHFDRHLSKSAKKRAEDRRRKEKSRECHTPSVTNVTANSGQKADQSKRESIDREEENRGITVTPAAQASPKPTVPNLPADEILRAFNSNFGLQCRLTKKRREQLRARWRDAWWRENWLQAIRHGARSPFLTGDNDRGWQCDLEFFLKPDTATKILEGKYDGNGNGGGRQLSRAESQERAFADGFAAIDAAVMAADQAGADDAVCHQESDTADGVRAELLGGGS